MAGSALRPSEALVQDPVDISELLVRIARQAEGDGQEPVLYEVWTNDLEDQSGQDRGKMTLVTLLVGSRPREGRAADDGSSGARVVLGPNSNRIELDGFARAAEPETRTPTAPRPLESSRPASVPSGFVAVGSDSRRLLDGTIVAARIRPQAGPADLTLAFVPASGGVRPFYMAERPVSATQFDDGDVEVGAGNAAVAVGVLRALRWAQSQRMSLPSEAQWVRGYRSAATSGLRFGSLAELVRPSSAASTQVKVFQDPSHFLSMPQPKAISPWIGFRVVVGL